MYKTKWPTITFFNFVFFKKISPIVFALSLAPRNVINILHTPDRQFVTTFWAQGISKWIFIDFFTIALIYLCIGWESKINIFSKFRLLTNSNGVGFSCLSDSFVNILLIDSSSHCSILHAEWQAMIKVIRVVQVLKNMLMLIITVTINTQKKTKSALRESKY